MVWKILDSLSRFPDNFFPVGWILFRAQFVRVMEIKPRYAWPAGLIVLN